MFLRVDGVVRVDGAWQSCAIGAFNHSFRPLGSTRTSPLAIHQKYIKNLNGHEDELTLMGGKSPPVVLTTLIYATFSPETGVGEKLEKQ